MKTEIEFILIISYRGIFRRRCVCLSFARRPCKQCSRVSHEMVQSVLLKITHLAISMEPIQLRSPPPIMAIGTMQRWGFRVV